MYCAVKNGAVSFLEVFWYEMLYTARIARQNACSFLRRQNDVEACGCCRYYLRSVGGVESIKVFVRTCDAVVRHICGREKILSALSRFSFGYAENLGVVPEHTSRALSREFEDKLVFSVIKRIIQRCFFRFPCARQLPFSARSST